MVKLQFFIFLLIAIQVCSANVFLNNLRADLKRAFYNSLADKFRGKLEELKSKMKTGDPSLGMPVLDPLNLKHYSLSIEREEVTAKADVSDVHVDYLSRYSVDNAFMKVPLPKHNTTLGLTWPLINGKLNYNLDAFLGNKLPVYGSGHITFRIEGFSFFTKADMHVKEYATIDRIYDTKIKVNKVKISITGLYQDDEISGFVSQVLSDLIPDALVEYQNEVTKEVNTNLKKYGNEWLSKHPLTEILG